MSDLLILDDDEVLSRVLARSMQKRGFTVHSANTLAQARQILQQQTIECAIVDLNLETESGLTLVKEIGQDHTDIRTVVLTGYASIATAVEAIKLGATHYLTKPADADEIIDALDREEGDVEIKLAKNPTPLNRVEWEHMQRVMMECNGNISEAARRLGVHRRTLQRKLKKRPNQGE